MVSLACGLERMLLEDENGVGWLPDLVDLPFGRLKMTALAEACTRGIAEEVEQRLASIPAAAMAKELEAVDDWAGSSPLHWAAFSASGARCARLLLKQGAPVTLPNGRDKSWAIHLAARYGRTETVRVL